MASEEGVAVELYIYDLTNGFASLLAPAILGNYPLLLNIHYCSFHFRMTHIHDDTWTIFKNNLVSKFMWKILNSDNIICSNILLSLIVYSQEL
jgi:hypothetical protein